MKTENELKEMLTEIESDGRLYYNTATVFSNAPLAMIQLVAETKSGMLRDILGLEQRNFHDERMVKSKATIASKNS